MRPQAVKQVLEEFPSPLHTLAEGGHMPGVQYATIQERAWSLHNSCKHDAAVLPLFATPWRCCYGLIGDLVMMPAAAT